MSRTLDLRSFLSGLLLNDYLFCLTKSSAVSSWMPALIDLPHFYTSQEVMICCLTVVQVDVGLVFDVLWQTYLHFTCCVYIFGHCNIAVHKKDDRKEMMDDRYQGGVSTKTQLLAQLWIQTCLCCVVSRRWKGLLHPLNYPRSQAEYRATSTWWYNKK